MIAAKAKTILILAAMVAGLNLPLAAHTRTSQNSRLGLGAFVNAPQPAFASVNQQNALGFPAELRQTHVRSRCTSKERDAETELDYFLARYYSAAQGRFTSPDEFPGGIVDPFTGEQVGQPGPLPYADITDPQTLNKYAYVRNNPLRYVDPDGHCPWCVGAVIGAVVGAGAQVASDLITGHEITVRNVAAAAVGGAITGATGGMGAEAGLAVQVAIAGSGSVVGGVAERAIKTGSMDKATADPVQIGTDMATGAGGKLLNAVATAGAKATSGGAVKELSRQATTAQTANRAAKVAERLEGAQSKLDRKVAAATATTTLVRKTTQKVIKDKAEENK